MLSAPVPVTRKLLERTGHEGRRLRRHGVQRGLRRHRPHVGPGLLARSRPLQPPGRGHRHRPSPRGERGAHHDDAAQPARGHRRPLRLPDHVRGRRPGQRHRHRAARGRVGASTTAMDFTFSTEQDDFRQAVRTTLAAEAPADLRAGHDRRPGGGDAAAVGDHGRARLAGGAGARVGRGPGARAGRPGGAPGGAGRLPFPGPFLSSAVAATLAAVRLGRRRCAGRPGRRPPPGHGGGGGARARRPPRHRARPGPRPTAMRGCSRGPSRSCSTAPTPTWPWWWPTTAAGLATFLLDAPAGEPGARPRRHPQDGAARPRRPPGAAGGPGRATRPRIWRRVLDDVNVALCGRVGGHRRAGPRAGGGVRQGAGAVRPAHRHLPGHQAQGRRHAPPRRAGPGGDALRGLDVGRRGSGARAGGGHVQGLRGRGGRRR